MNVSEFEQAVLRQTPIPPGHYDSAYFVDGWRAGRNRYDLETRREAEGIGPSLIKEVFEPRRVLDLGCGPGFLMLFLHELGVEVEGVDFSQASLDLAPPEIADRISVAPVTDPPLPPRSYDLVVCREVLEHLTVVQVTQAVRTMCRMTSRYVYLTTRFHPAPRSLLDFTDEPETDPTHITLLNKDLLRCLFVLEGFRRRDDLERRMDWAKKDRVLVYERA